jgi:hypothetical protein
MFAGRNIDIALDKEIAIALEELKKLRDDPEKYDAVVERIAKLDELKSPKDRLKPASVDTVLIVAANIFGVLWLTRFEKENVIKAPHAFRSVIRLKG